MLPPPPPRPIYAAPPGIGWLPGVPPQPREVPPPPTEAALAIPLDTRRLVREALDLLTRSDSGLRGPSFYIGFMMLVTLAPFVALFGLSSSPSRRTCSARSRLGPATATAPAPTAWPSWLLPRGHPRGARLHRRAVEARSIATAVIGARVEGRPLRLVESISLARRGSGPCWGPSVLIGFITGLITTIASGRGVGLLGPVEPMRFGVPLRLGRARHSRRLRAGRDHARRDGCLRVDRRSFGLVRLRKRLAVVVTLFGVLSQFIVLFGL